MGEVSVRGIFMTSGGERARDVTSGDEKNGRDGESFTAVSQAPLLYSPYSLFSSCFL